MKKLKVFDVHIHFCPLEENYDKAIEKLFKYSEQCNVAKMCLISDLGKERVVENNIRKNLLVMLIQTLIWMNRK
jgi:hypothetical protein